MPHAALSPAPIDGPLTCICAGICPRGQLGDRAVKFCLSDPAATSAWCDDHTDDVSAQEREYLVRRISR
jgi:hypothetical protein